MDENMAIVIPEDVVGPFSGEYRFLSNFYPSKIRADGIDFPTVEHAFQAQKTVNVGEQTRIAMLPTPGQAKRAGRQLDLRPDWDTNKKSIMLLLLWRKFDTRTSQGILLTKQLLDTGTRPLIELNTWHDQYWGVCTCANCDTTGFNWLGWCLAQVRIARNMIAWHEVHCG